MLSVSSPTRSIEGPGVANLFMKEESIDFDSCDAGIEFAKSAKQNSFRSKQSPVRLSSKQILPTSTEPAQPPSEDQAPVSPQRKLSTRQFAADGSRGSKSSNRSSSSRSKSSRGGNRSSKSTSKRIDPQAPKKSVSFNKLDTEGPDVRHIEHLKTLPRREIGKRWISGSEFRNNQVAATQHLECQTRESSEFSARGLERLTEDGMNNFLRTRREALIAVLQQQHICPDRVRQKEELIASAYRSGSADARERAQHRGRLDAQEVKDYVTTSSDMETVRREQEAARAEQTESEAKRKRKVINRLLSSFRVQKTVDG